MELKDIIEAGLKAQEKKLESAIEKFEGQLKEKDKVDTEVKGEVQALADVRAKGLDPAGSTVYVTLEPCNHTGRTPPCVDALIEAEPAMVIVAMSDPNPLVGGQGLERLKSAGIEVRCGLLEAEAIALNLGFISRMTRGLPWVREAM